MKNSRPPPAAPFPAFLSSDSVFAPQDGYWELTPALGELLNFDADLFANVFLKSRGIDSLGKRLRLPPSRPSRLLPQRGARCDGVRRSAGVRARADILRLLATLLVLQLMRAARLEEGRLLRTLFSLDDSSQQRWERSRNPKGRPAGADASLRRVTRCRSERWRRVERAVGWSRRADRRYPCICSRLEFGLSWESSTRQLLGFEDAHGSSPLARLKLRLRPAPLLVS